MRIDFSPRLQMNPLMAIGAGLGVANMIGKFISGAKQTKEAKAINPIFNQYQKSPFAQRQLGLAQTMFNDPSMGMRAQMMNNISSNNASFLNNVNKNATSSSDALALGAAGLGQSNENMFNANMRFNDNRLALLDNLNQAYGTNIREGDKEYESMLQKYQMDSQRKDALRSSGAQNKYGAVSDLASMAFTAGTSGMPFKDMFGFGGGNKLPRSSFPQSRNVIIE